MYHFRQVTRIVEHPVGTVVAKPPSPRCCWGTVEKHRAVRFPLPRQCSARPQAERLTCRAHAKREEAARRLQNVLAAQEYGGIGDLGEGESL